MPSVDGIVSGLDTTGLIQAIVAAQTVTLDALRDQKNDFEAQREAVAGVKNRMTSLSDAIRGVDTVAELASYAVSGTSSQYRLTTHEGARPGTYAIRVDQLATAQSSATSGFADPDALTLGTGTVGVTIGGNLVEVVIDGSNNSYTGLAAALDAVDGISAFVLNTGVGANPYQLVVQSDATGAANGFSIDVGLVGGDVPVFTEKSAASNAKLEVSGIAVESASNTLVDAIPGITLELVAPGTSGDVTSVSDDVAGTRVKLQAVIDAYNAVQDYYAQMTVYNADEGMRGPLVGESTTRRAMEDLGSMVSNAYLVPGTALSSLAQVGVSTGRDGRLTLDAAAFDAAFTADPDGVSTLITSPSGPLTSLADRVAELYVDPENGALISRDEGLEETIQELEEQINTASDRIEAQVKLLRQQFSAMEVALGQLRATQNYLSAFFAQPAAE